VDSKLGQAGHGPSFHRRRATDRIVVLRMGFGGSGCAPGDGMLGTPEKDGKPERVLKIALAATRL
jgi:hypothetical protein